MTDIELNPQMERVLTLVDEGSPFVLVTGRAGTGKSTLLRYLRMTADRKTVVLAPTGRAAMNVQGQTIHSFFGFPPSLILPENIRRSRQVEKFKALQTLIIDEVSMVRVDLMEAIDRALRLNRGRSHLPFGGVQIIAFGDLLQLPPVVGRDLDDYFQQEWKGPFFFLSRVFDQRGAKGVELEKVYRQDDPVFLGLLEELRHAELTQHALGILNQRVRTMHEALAESPHLVVLTTTNAAANAINMDRLRELHGPQYHFAAHIDGTLDKGSHPTDDLLSLKAGAQVMFVRNDTDRRWVNGSVGTFVGGTPDELHVRLGDKEVVVEREEWKVVRYEFDSKTNQLDEVVIGGFEQFPLKLAWAMTIHKSQGMTLDSAYIDLGRGSFASGQTYVAISRCVSLDGLYLSRPLFERDLILDERAYGYREAFDFD